MPELSCLTGKAAALRFENLDTDQIIPKQFLRGIDKSGLAEGILYDHRFDATGAQRPEFVLNRPEYADTSILIGGANFGCGSSREHAVWGLQQFGIRAVIAPSFGEIFYSNAMNNRLLLVMLPREVIERLMGAADADSANEIRIDVEAMQVRTPAGDFPFELSARHRRMFLEGLDMIGLSLKQRDEIEQFARRYWDTFPWAKDVARRTRDRLGTT
ncbi:3-isopropylmalate dehydratase small subunit [Cupriavidus oxalaticus]|jgi:3-isopropylmalate/(R)-2-methylmalate dehydratase small subunit|uniref:3-isopropylmalate dehydratase small subunit n=1 Tax=Cupriavidus oxalaticus TaxID=96344 RepID=A0A976G9Y9_9BURK|nr:3-isopropylmalate dehydratase small subunit [Cupriavidus oxalaticus]QRQ87045.1 3-isopropylmalate dehydratase small subunit [Cupriavidus oxalaticus]QRQ94627.1 3-isopropylmalate dehydratase small subunit [Cupriavidus oxalaticus]WQD83274.1 3-isopropylmalate dehydratase small subunit [Cupriavidus oxalaticus]SPC14108.1 3-isopropylmalate isomerase subunit [Cupriavidus oxalaticus]